MNETAKTLYTLWELDLDVTHAKEIGQTDDDEKNPNYDFKEIWHYTCEDVDDKPFLKMHVRAPSYKDVVDNNEKLAVFVLHHKLLYSWIDGKVQKSNNTLSEESKFETVSTYFSNLDEDIFFLMEDEQKGASENNYSYTLIRRYEIGKNDFKKEVVFQEMTKTVQIVNFSIDTSANRMLIYSKILGVSESLSNKVQILDLMKKKVIFEILVNNFELKGRLDSGLYTLTDGHIYYSNNVIKIRYDLIDQPNNSRFSED
jgi:hypothetical protein